MEAERREYLLIKTGLDKFIQVGVDLAHRHETTVEMKEAWDILWHDLKEAAVHARAVTMSEQLSSAITADLSRMFRIGRIATPQLSSELSRGMVTLAARYGLDTAVTVAHTLSECMEMATRTPNILERRRNAMSISQPLSRTNLVPRDIAFYVTAMLNYVDAPRIKWELEELPSGIIRMRAAFGQ